MALDRLGKATEDPYGVQLTPPSSRVATVCQVLGRIKRENLAAQAALSLRAVLPSSGCFNVRKLNQTLEQQEAGCTRCRSWSYALGQSFAHCSSGGLGLGTNLDHLSSDQNGLSNISQALNKSLVTRPVWKNLWRELKTLSFPSLLPPPILSGRDEEPAQSVKGSLHKQGDLSSDPQYT